MALEASDLSDGAILDKTQQFSNGNGQVQFKIMLPSGRQLESEWIKDDLKKKAMVAWLDVVKAEAVADSDLARMEAREKAMAAQSVVQQAPVQTQEASFTVDTSAQTSSVIQSARTAGAPTASAVSPDSFVEQGLQAADNEVEYWTQQAATATVRLLKAQQERIKWSQIKSALSANGANTVNGSQDSGSQGDSKRAAGSSNSPRRRRTRKPPEARIGDADISTNNVRASDNSV